ncbi:hypothetical protein QBC32DRAFT_354997 [Pseudoneurospora amorphoporcata]|uniref:Uncharacterized protein n=1 Tax=Pseudoneurospora amorphoporcata TaxID=241081 RepID=A0AAN6SB67_9PEZI|nr:hypothetical protein QBC32DRAFT_354997 [Pseudoneurospora amorphoporcata]
MRTNRPVQILDVMQLQSTYRQFRCSQLEETNCLHVNHPIQHFMLWNTLEVVPDSWPTFKSSWDELSQPTEPLSSGRSDRKNLPSWTWASIDRPCTRDPVRYYDNLLFKVEHVDLSYATDDPTGDILPGGRLHLRGILMPAKLIPTTHEQPEIYWKIIIEGIELEGVTRYVERFIRAREPFKDGSPVSLNHFQENFDVENAKGKSFAMPAWKNTYGISTQRSLMAILLCRLLDAEKGMYERLGLFKQYDENCNLVLAMRADVNGERKKERERVPCAEFREGMHSFIVV